MNLSYCLISSGVSIVGSAFLSNAPSEILNPARYDDATLKGCLIVSVIFLIYTLVKVIDKSEKKEILYREKVEKITEIFVNEGKRREENFENAINIISEKLQGVTFSVDKMNNFCDTFVKQATQEVLQKGLKSFQEREDR